MSWVPHSGKDPGGSELLKDAILKTSFPYGDYFTWISAESQCVKDLKEFLETIRGANADWIKATGYWKKDPAHA